MMNEVYLEIHPVDGHRRVCGRSYIETRCADREVAREILHELVEEILDHLYPSPPREAAKESVINEIRKARANPCPRMKASSSSCEYCRPDGKCGAIVYATYPPQYDDCVFLKRSNA